MKIFSWGRKNISFGLSLVLTLAVVMVCFVSSGTTAYAATNVDTFAELKAACEAGGTVNITSAITATGTITIPEDVSVTLTCDHAAGSNSTDISRGKNFHKHLFVIESGATLTVRCCISGNSKDGDGNLRGYGSTGTETDGYYGWALIKNLGGTLKLDSDKSVLKNNYNAISVGDEDWKYNNKTYYAEKGTGDDADNGVGGSAIYNFSGKFEMSAGRIYGCIGDSGPALYFISGWDSHKAKITGGSMYSNLARRYGGAIFLANKERNSITSSSSGVKDFTSPRTINSSGDNARLTISGGYIHGNKSRLGGGAIWTGHGATLYMTNGEIYENVCIESNGGAIRANAGAVSSISSTSHLCLGIPGGQIWIAGGKIYDNTSETEGGGIAAARLSADSTDTYSTSIYTNNKVKITGGSIYGNTSFQEGGGIWTASDTTISGGSIYNNVSDANGAGVYCNLRGKLTMTGGEIYGNNALPDGDGGGIFLVSGGPACSITGGTIHDNEAVNGGGIRSNRTNGLTLGNVKIYNNIATYGGGVFTTGLCNITGGYYYGNEDEGVRANSGTLNIKGGKHGFSAYTDGSTYTVKRNYKAQIVVGSNATCTITDPSSNNPRVMTALDDSAENETVSANYGLLNYGTVNVPATDGEIYFFGKGTAIRNEGTFNIEGNLKIYTTPKAGETTVQQRRGIHNTATGTVTVNSSDFEVKYCGERGVYNEGEFNLAKGSIHHNTVPNVEADFGGGVYNTGSGATFTLSGGSVYGNTAYRGAGMYNISSGTLKVTGGKIYNNVASLTGGGVQNGATLTMSGGSVYDNTAGTYGGGVYNASGATGSITGGEIYSNKATRGGGTGNNGTLTVGGSVKIYNHTVDEYGGGAYNGGSGTTNITGGSIYENTAKTYGGGVYVLKGGTAKITGGAIYKNVAPSGGGVGNHGDLTIGGSAKIHTHSVDKFGGGVYSGGTLKVTGGEIYNNETKRDGAGIYNCGAAILSGGKITSNTAHYKNGNMIQGAGGGVYSTKDITLNGIAITGNTATTGGGVYVETEDSEAEISTLTIDGSEITENIANDGAGVYGYACTIDMKSGSVSSNHAGKIGEELSTGTGGGIGIAGDGNNGLLKLSGGQINNNTVVGDLDGSISGGGVYCHWATIEMTGGEISGNSSVYDGGGVYLEERATLNMTGGTITSNTAGERGGGVCLIYYWDSIAIIDGNAVITGNIAGTDTTEGLGGGIYNGGCVGVYVKGDASINKNKATYGGGIFNDDYGVLEITGGNTNNNEATYGGGVYNYGAGAVFTMSAGKVSENNATKDGGGLYLDETTLNNIISGGEIYGNNGSELGGGIYWAGAAELTACEIYQNHAGSGGGIYFTPVDTSTELAIVDGINIYENTAYTGGGVYLKVGSLNMSGGSVYGNTAEENGGGFFIPANGAECFISGGEIYNNKALNGAGVYSQRINSLTVSGGKLYGNGASANGGGIYTVGENATLKIIGGKIYENTAAKNGGGLYLDETTLNNTISGGEIYGNKATELGGGIYWAGAAELTACEIYQNHAGNGGGIYFTPVDTSIELVIVDGIDIYENTATKNGGGIYSADGKINLTGGKLHSNTTEERGGGVYNTGSSAQFTLSGGEINNNSANRGAGIYNTSDSSVIIKNGEIYNNNAINSGGGVFSDGIVTVENGYVYNNINSGIVINKGTGVINGGFYGISKYKDDANYTAARNTVVQIMVGSEASCSITGKNTTRVVSELTDDEAINANVGIRNGGTLTVEEACTSFDIYGTGTSVINTGTLNVNGAFRIATSENDGSTTLQKRLGIQNISTGIVNFNSDAADIMYCGNRGVYNEGEFNLAKGSIHHCASTDTTGGGGVYNTGNKSFFNMSGGEIYNNTASACGGGVYNYGTFTITGGSIHDNVAEEKGGGIHNYKTLNVSNATFSKNEAKTEKGGAIYSLKELKVVDSVFTENTAYTGGGINCQSSLDVIGCVFEKNVSTSKNENDSGGGIWCGGTTSAVLTITDCVIKENTAWAGGGVHSACNVIITDSVISGNTATRCGAGVYAFYGATVNNCEITNNVAGPYGGGIYHLGSSDTEALTVTDSTIAHNTATSEGAGICAHATYGITELTNSNIEYNTVKGEGGGIYTYGTINLNSGSINNNTANRGSGGGMYLYTDAVLNQLSGDISNNNANYGAGVYNRGTYNLDAGSVFENKATYLGGGTYNRGTLNIKDGAYYDNEASENGDGIYNSLTGLINMSGKAIVKPGDKVFLEEYTYIGVSDFTGDKNIRANVTGDNMVTGRVIAKYGDNVDAEGTKALYWNTDTVKEDEQYFIVEGRFLRAGNQGLAEHYDAINNQDVYLTEKYTVAFDMNPSLGMKLSSITHTIGKQEWTFNALSGWVNEGVYHKYWNEELSFDPGHAASGAAAFDGWSLKGDETVRYTPDATNVIAADFNKNIVVLAEWLSVIDIDYDGNGATEGEGWTEEKVDISQDYDASDDNNAFSRQEIGEDGQMRLFSFMGWSLDSGAVAKDYSFGDPEVFEADITADSGILKNAAVSLEGRSRQVATMYAVWDEYPTIEAVDRWFTLDEAREGKITLEELMSTAFACDGFDKNGDEIKHWDGDNTDFYDINNKGELIVAGEEEFTIVDFGATDFTSFKSSGKVTITYKAVDKVGNTTFLDVDIYIIDKDQQIGDISELFTRFISSRYFKDAEGKFVSEVNGGLNTESKWVKDADYTEALEKALGNTKNEETGEWDFVYETWTFDIEEIQKVKEYIETHGLGNSKENDALRQFYTTFK